MTLNRFCRAIEQTPISLPRTALLVAQSVAYRNLDVEGCMDKLSEIVAQVRESDVLDAPTAEEKAENLAEYLYSVIGLQGDVDSYYDPRNSFLNDVLLRGLGIPITLSIIYTDIAKKVGLEAAGVGLPGHFIVRVRGTRPNIFIDPFTGLRLSARDCAELVRETTGYDGTFKPEWLNPMGELGILTRLLNNLRINYMRLEEWEKVGRVMAHLRLIAPNDPTYFRDEALIAFSQRNMYKSSRALEAYLEAVGDTEDAEIMRLTLGQMLGQWVALN